MTETTRRYDIDWLRVIAIALLIIYHIAIAFQPWGVFIGFLQSEKSLESIWIPMAMLNVWRIPLLFFVSGMGVCFAIRKRKWKLLMAERARRILLPLVFGIFAIVPLHMFIWQKYYSQDLVYSPNQGHLWFLANIFIYVLLLSPLFFYIKTNKRGAVGRILEKLFRTPLGWLVVLAVFVLEAWWVNPEVYETYAMTLHGFILGLLAFLFGFIGVQSGDLFWRGVKRWRWVFLGLAGGLYALRFIEFQLQAPNYLKAIESLMWIFSLFGFGYKYLNHQSKLLSYLSQAAYPIYILHMLFLYGASYLIVPLAIPNFLKLILVVLITFAGCFAMFEFLIRRVRFLGPVFGLKR